MEKQILFIKVRDDLHKVYDQYKSKYINNPQQVIGFQDCFIALIDIFIKMLEEKQK